MEHPGYTTVEQLAEIAAHALWNLNFPHSEPTDGEVGARCGADAKAALIAFLQALLNAVESI